jgi:lipoprotein-anchoring transpeptidase ErfK/SrfK
MRRLLLAAAVLLACGTMISAADAQEVVVHVSKSRQTMYVYVDGYLEHRWPVSTARDGYSTPSGSYYPTGFDRFHRSSRYHYAPMPYSIFFHGGYAIHGSYDIDSLGYPASHGCIRLHPDDAAELYGLVRGSYDTRIVISR